MGKKHGSRRKKYKTQAVTSEGIKEVVEPSSAVTLPSSDVVNADALEDTVEEIKDTPSEYVVYQTGPDEEENETCFELDKKLGWPHPFIDPKVTNQLRSLAPVKNYGGIGEPEKEQWSRWQRRRPDVETVR